jgi:hypothetical protein
MRTSIWAIINCRLRRLASASGPSAASAFSYSARASAHLCWLKYLLPASTALPAMSSGASLTVAFGADNSFESSTGAVRV